MTVEPASSVPAADALIPGRFVDLQSDAVSESVTEVVGIACVGDDLSRRGVDLLERHPGRERLPAGALRGGDQLIDVELPLRSGRQHECASHVGVIAAHQGAEVDLHEIAVGQHRVGGPVVRDRRVRTGRHDGFERHAVGAMIEHQRLELAAYLFLCPARPKSAALDQVAQRRVGGFARQPQQRDLTGVLDFAQRLHGARSPYQLSPITGRLGEHGESVDGHHVTLEAQPLHPVGGGPPGQMRPARPLDDDLGVGGLLRRLGACTARRWRAPAFRRSSRISSAALDPVKPDRYRTLTRSDTSMASRSAAASRRAAGPGAVK